MSKFCGQCGSSVPENAVFCPECGSRLSEFEATTELRENTPTAPVPVTSSGNILLYPDGKYRWVYELNLFRNPSILFLLFKIFGWILFGMWGFLTLISLGDPGFLWKGFLDFIETYLIFAAAFFGFILLGYALFALFIGGKYCVLFIMDEKSVTHLQQEKHVKKAELISALTVLAGAASNNPTMVGIGLNSSRSSMTSTLENVKSVQAFPRRNLIKVNQTLAKNQVYAEDADFEFVRHFLETHCPNAKIR